MAGDDQRVKMIAQEIERYLVTRPDAADTVEGVSRWWLARLGLDAADAEVEAALHLLVARRAILKTILPDGNALYVGAKRGG
jgi:hypothetical protein